MMYYGAAILIMVGFDESLSGEWRSRATTTRATTTTRYDDARYDDANTRRGTNGTLAGVVRMKSS